MSGPRVRRLTPPGRGGVALLAVEGPGAAALLGALFARPLPAPGRVAPGALVERGEPLDEVLVARAAEDAFEVGCHGGPAVVERVVEALRRAGARAADGAAPDLRDASDRTAAEAAALLPGARTELGCQALLAQRQGALARAVADLAARLETEPAAALEGVDALLGTWPLGRALLAPPRVALVGLPNAGKSSLLNALLGRARVLVSAEPGTTRDAVEELVDLDGVPARLVDTAGQRETHDPVEAAGVARASEAARRADLRLVVVDATRPDDPAAQALLGACALPRLVVATKVDLLDDAARAALRARLADLAPLLASSVTGEGLPELRAAARAALVGPPRAMDAPLVFTERQRGLLEGARRALLRGAVERARACLGAVAG